MLARRAALVAVAAAVPVGAWWLVVAWAEPPPYVLPAPGAVLAVLTGEAGRLARHASVTAVQAWAGLAVAIAVGLPVGALCGTSRVGAAVVLPGLVGLQTVPKVALAPVLLLWFGPGPSSKVLLAALLAAFPVVVSTARGIDACMRRYRLLADSIGLSRSRRFVAIELPGAEPYVFAGLRLAGTLAIVGAVVGEFVGARAGLGRLVVAAAVHIDTALLLAALAVLTALGVATVLALAGLEAAVGHRRGSLGATRAAVGHGRPRRAPWRGRP